MDRLPPNDPGYGDPVNPNWRGERMAGRNRRLQTLPSSRQELTLWLQYGGWRIVAIIAAVFIIAIFGLIFLSGQGRPLQSSGEVATTEPITAPLFQDQPTITPVLPESSLGTQTQGLNGVPFRVFNTGVEGLFLRPNPSTDGSPIKTLPEGTIVTVVGDDAIGPDRIWKHVRDVDGAEGWAASDYLQPAQ